MLRTCRIIAIVLAIILPTMAPGQPTAGDDSIRISVRMSPHPSPYLSDWISHRETITVLIVNSSGHDIDARLDARVTQSGRTLASTNLAAMPITHCPPGMTEVHGDVIASSATIRIDPTIEGLTLRSGMLPVGPKSLCVRLRDVYSERFWGTEECADFVVTAYTPPVLVQPEDGARFVIGRGYPLFRWEAPTPNPAEFFTFRFTVYEQLPGQTKVESAAGNAPFYVVEVDGSQKVLGGDWLGTEEHPGTFIWKVEALRPDGNPVGPMIGAPELREFILDANLDPVWLHGPTRDSGGPDSDDSRLMPAEDVFSIEGRGTAEAIGNEFHRSDSLQEQERCLCKGIEGSEATDPGAQPGFPLRIAKIEYENVTLPLGLNGTPVQTSVARVTFFIDAGNLLVHGGGRMSISEKFWIEVEGGLKVYYQEHQTVEVTKNNPIAIVLEKDCKCPKEGETSEFAKIPFSVQGPFTFLIALENGNNLGATLDFVTHSNIDPCRFNEDRMSFRSTIPAQLGPGTLQIYLKRFSNDHKEGKWDWYSVSSPSK